MSAMKKRLLHGGVFSFFALATLSSVQAETYYYNRGQISASINQDYAAWAVYNEEFGAYENSPTPIPVDGIGGAETVLRRMDSATSLTMSQMSGLDATNVYIKSIEYVPTVDLNGASANDWQFYTFVNGGTCDMSIGNVIVNADYKGGSVEGSVLKIRKRQSDAYFNVTLREGASAYAGGLYLGTTGSGEFLTSLTVGADDSGVAFTVDGSNAEVAPSAGIRIYASEIHGLGADQTSVKTINVTKGSFRLCAGETGSSTVPISAQNADLSMSLLNLGKASYFYYGDASNNMSGWIKLGDVVVSGTTSDTFGLGNNSDRAIMNFYTTATEGDTAGSAPIQVGTITLDSGVPENDMSRVDFVSNANSYIEAIVSKNNGSDENDYQGVSFSAAGKTVTVGDLDLAVRRIIVNCNLVVENDFTSSFRSVVEGSRFTNIQLADGASFSLLGNLNLRGGVAFDAGKTAGSGTVRVEIGGISGGNGDQMNRLSTSYFSKNNVETLIVLNGDFDAEFSGRLHDMGEKSTVDSITGANYLSLEKNGSGTQILRGNNYYRGTTTVNDGTLFLRADKRADWGIAQLNLNGGRFGAIGSDSDIGKVIATDLTWSNAATIAVDFAADGTCDLIALSGNFLKADGDSGGKYVFEFSGTFAAGETMYKILSWTENSTVDFDESDFDYTYNDPSRAALEGHFLKQDNALYFVSVPEPAEYAAIFGIFAVGFALLRRRRK